MAKTREYTITSGDYEDYRIVARVRGPATPALSTLWKRFAREYGIPERSSVYAQDLAYYGGKFGAEERMSKHGLLLNYEYGSRAAWAFVSWLKDKGFEILPYDGFFVPA